MSLTASGWPQDSVLPTPDDVHFRPGSLTITSRLSHKISGAATRSALPLHT